MNLLMGLTLIYELCGILFLLQEITVETQAWQYDFFSGFMSLCILASSYMRSQKASCIGLEVMGIGICFLLIITGSIILSSDFNLEKEVIEVKIFFYMSVSYYIISFALVTKGLCLTIEEDENHNDAQESP